MKTKTDKEILEEILGVIAKDEDLLCAFAACIEVPQEQMEEFIDFVEIPELTRKLPNNPRRDLNH